MAYKREPIDFTEIFYSEKYGECIILEELPDKIRPNDPSRKDRMVLIKYLNTGTIVEANYNNLKCGIFPKDYYAKIVYGVGCLGIINIPIKGLIKKIYKIWSHMLSRCYNPYDKLYHSYGAIGIKVCDRWLCFEYFLEDVQKLENYDKWCNNTKLYQIDKDKLQLDVPKNQRIYSKETCMFLTFDENCSIMLSEKYNKDINLDRYIGVRLNNKTRDKNPSCYGAILSLNGENIYLGSFDSAEAAAVYRNYFVIMNNKETKLNDVNMTMDEAIKHKSGYDKNKLLYRLINNKIDKSDII